MLDFVGRLMLVSIFLWSGFLNKPINFRHVSARIGEVGLPFGKALCALAAAFEIVASFEVIFPAVAASQALYLATLAALAFYTMLTAALFHPFWAHKGQERAGHLVNFLKNMGLTGAFLLLIDQVVK